MKNLNFKKKEINSKGITLVALVVTIIILLVLAGITVASLTGDNGLIGKAGEAKNSTEKSQEKEELEVAITGLYDKRGNLNAAKVVYGINKDIKNLNSVTDTEGNFPVKVEYKNGHKYGITKDGDIIENLIGAGDTAPNDTNAVYISGSNIAVIPAGFTVSGTEGETKIEDGLVVRDGNQNEWVWIPVRSTDLVLMYTHNNTNTDWNMLGTSVKTLLRTRELIKVSDSEDNRLGTRTLNRTNPGLTADPYCREPDVLSAYDTNPTYRTQAGFGDLVDMATKLKDDYKDMIDSVRENGGFYIGRYELGNGRKSNDTNDKPQVKAGTVMNSRNWYQLYSACKSFTTGNMESRMIWGCQWDQVCRFIKGDGANTIIDNSKSYGNYNNSTGNAATNSGSSNFDNTTGQLNSNWKIKNLYDIAGNCWEWTQEAYGTNKRARCGRWLRQ